MTSVRILSAALFLLSAGCLQAPPTPAPEPSSVGVYADGFVAERQLKSRIWRACEVKARDGEFASAVAYLEWFNPQIEAATAAAFQPAKDEVQARIGGDKWSNAALAELAAEFAAQAERSP